MKSEKKDLWLGLKMVTPGPEKWFWFNIRDEMSFWMTAEEQIQFKQCLLLPLEQQPPKWLLPSAFRHVVEPTPKVATSTKASSRRKRRSTFGEIDTPTAASLAKNIAVAAAKAPNQGKGKKGDFPTETPSARKTPTSTNISSIAEDSAAVPDATLQGPATGAVLVEGPGDSTSSSQSPGLTPAKIPYDAKYAAESFG